MKHILSTVIFLLLFTGNVFSQTGGITTTLSAGMYAPEIKLPNFKGDTIALSSLRGKLVLIDFWASWCGPCLREQPTLKKLYNKYKKSGFEIYAVSLDSKKTEWQNAVRKYKITWTQVSDLKFWNSNAAMTYGIEELPYNLLIDSSGKIININLHDSDLDDAIFRYVTK